MSDLSRFHPSDPELRRIAMAQQSRAEGLARRLASIRRAIVAGQPKEVLLALSEGSADRGSEEGGER